MIFDFNENSDIRGWRVVDDVVMGGESSGTFILNNEGIGVYRGNVSLDNNGGFSSLRYGFKRTSVEGYTKVALKLKGDGKSYQFRIKSNSSDDHSYITTFRTTGEWQEIEIVLEEMYPSFRGRKLDKPNFSNDSIEEIAFLIGNKRNEEFELFLDKIELR